MTDKVDYKKFQEMLQPYYPNEVLTEEDAAEAYRNLGEFITLLLKISRKLSRTMASIPSKSKEPIHDL